MRSAIRCLAVVLCVLGTLSGFSLADEAAAPNLSVTPSQITIAGVAGKEETRTLLLRAGAPVSGLGVIPMDLYRDNGNAVFPAGSLQAKLPETGIEAGGFLSVPLVLNLKDVPRGEFKGQMLFKYQGGEIAVPVTIRVKDHFWWPLVILILGVAVGMIVSAYRSGGKPRDEALVRRERIKAQMEKDADLKNSPFSDHIGAHLLDADADLQNQKWNEAKESLNRAEAILLKWRKSKTDWAAQFKYYHDLEEMVDGMLPDAAYRQSIRRDMEEIFRDAPDLENPDNLREQLNGLGKRINVCLRLEGEFLFLENMWNSLTDEDTREEWRTTLLDLRKKVENLSPDPQNPAGHESVVNEIRKAVMELRKFSARADDAIEKGREFSMDREDAVAGPYVQPAPLPLIRIFSKGTAARSRLKTFTWFTYVLAVGFLASAG
jgi:hypothetical protein